MISNNKLQIEVTQYTTHRVIYWYDYIYPMKINQMWISQLYIKINPLEDVVKQFKTKSNFKYHANWFYIKIKSALKIDSSQYTRFSQNIICCLKDENWLLFETQYRRLQDSEVLYKNFENFLNIVCQT